MILGSASSRAPPSAVASSRACTTAVPRLAAGNEPALDDGRIVFQPDEARVDALGFAERAGDEIALGVGAQNADQNGFAAERDNIAGDVAGAADHHSFGFEV